MATTKAKPKIKIQPLEDRVVIWPDDEGESMRGGLYIPDTAKEKPTQGEVVAVGAGMGGRPALAARMFRRLPSSSAGVSARQVEPSPGRSPELNHQGVFSSTRRIGPASRTSGPGQPSPGNNASRPAPRSRI